jgi:DNA-binding response OmpR family regulator
MKYKILLVEDEEKLHQLISGYLTRFGLDVVVPDDFTKVLELFEQEMPHLVILDIQLPYYDGYHLCRAIRKKSNVPILFLSARNSNLDQVLGIELGADDYLIKPIDLEVLHAKIHASLRRAYGEYANNTDDWLVLNDVRLNENTFRLYCHNLSTELTKNEMKLMKCLMKQPGRVVTREKLLSELWDEVCFVDDNTLTVNIARVKSKCEELGLAELIRTKRGVGYIWMPAA